MLTPRIAAPFIALFSLGLGGCIKEYVEVDMELFDGSVDRIVLTVESGDLELHGEERQDIEVNSDLSWTGERPVTEVSIRDDVLYVWATCESQMICSSSYSISIPSQLDADIEIERGGADVMGTDGELVLQLGSGGLVLDDVGGEVAASVDSGGAEGSGLRAEWFYVDVGSGGADLSWSSAPREVEIEVSSGGADLEVPSGSYAVVATAGSGGAEIEGIELDPNSQRSIRVDVGSGGIELNGR